MGIVVDALAIAFGGLFGSKLQKKDYAENYHTLGIGIMIVSLVGFVENMFNVQGQSIASENLIIVLFAYMIGSKAGEALHLEERLSYVGKSKNASLNSFVDAALFFGVGGLQICGPVALAINNDNSQLLIKSVVDIPFAIVFGSTCGKIVSLSALPVAAIQILIAVIAYFSAAVFSAEMTAQLCAVGYIILFFSGFNLMTDGRYKINNINMLPGIFFVILFHVMNGIVGRI